MRTVVGAGSGAQEHEATSGHHGRDLSHERERAASPTAATVVMTAINQQKTRPSGEPIRPAAGEAS